MQYNVLTAKKVKKFLKKHPSIIPLFIKAIKQLELDPYTPMLDIKKLQGENFSYRLRIGKYRFLYEIIEEKIIIYFYNAGSRGDIYKK